MEKAVDHFINVRDLDDDKIVAMMRDLGIDIAIDMTGYTANARVGIFARRSAPVQVNYLGYSATIAVNPAVIAKPSLVRDGTTTITGSLTGASAFTPNPTGGPASFGTLIGRVINYAFGTQAQSGVAQPTPSVSGLGPLGNLSAPFAAPGDLASFASTLVATQSGEISNINTQLTTEQSVQTTLQAQVSSSSSVNTDSELSKMLVLQNAYGATARIIAATQTMWNDLLSTVPAH
jgi:flagellar hook-associated protein 1 FlgK